jgi:hypothetical protein
MLTLTPTPSDVIQFTQPWFRPREANSASSDPNHVEPNVSHPADHADTRDFTLAHPEFAREGGRIQYATYAHPKGPFAREIQFVEMTLR